MTDNPASLDQKQTALFLSYSRMDVAFLTRLAAALEARGDMTVFDQSERPHHDPDLRLTAQDEWWTALKTMIAASDVMVFIVTPDSAKSGVCDDEIAHAKSLGKRVIAILRRDIDFNAAPERLRALNVGIDGRSDEEPAFGAALDALCAELDLDIEWHRSGTRLMRQADQWVTDGRSEDRLLRASTIEEADAWAARRPHGAPQIGRTLLSFLDASRAYEAAQRDKRLRRARLVLWLTSGLAVLVLVSAGVVFALSFFTGYNSTLGLLLDKTHLIIEAVAERTRRQLDPAQQQVEFLAGLVGDGHLNINDRAQLDTAMRASFAAAEHIDRIEFVDPDLQGRSWTRIPDGGVVPVDRDWREHREHKSNVQAARRAESSFWAKIDYVPDMPDGSEGVFINVHMPVRKDGEFLGLFAASLQTHELSPLLQHVTPGGSETAFILSGRDRVIAHPALIEGMFGISHEQPAYSRPSRSLIPDEAVHPFQAMAVTDST